METKKMFFLAIVVIYSFNIASVFAQVIDNSDTLYVPFGDTYILDGVHEYNEYVNIEGTLYVTSYNGSGTTGTVELHAPEIDISGTIDADGRGYRGHGNYQEGPGIGGYPGGGAGYGGGGGDSGHGGSGGSEYGTEDGQDIDMGSGGGDTGFSLFGGGDGGGTVSLYGEIIDISGTVTAIGEAGLNYDWGAGGASGGGILIQAPIVDVFGILCVNGGAGGNGIGGGGGGAGGRLKIIYCCGALNTTGSTITYNGGAGGTGSWAGQAGQSGTYHTEIDYPAPWRGHEATYARWEFNADELNPAADELYNPYGEPNLIVEPVDPCWLPTWGGKQGVWPLSGSITVQIPNRPSGPASMKIVWIQIVWAPSYPGMLDEVPNVMETSSFVTIPSAKYPDCILEEFVEDAIPRNWNHSTYIIMLKPNPESEEITIEGAISVDRIIIETICFPGLRTGDLNGDNKVDLFDFAIFADHWLEGTVP